MYLDKRKKFMTSYIRTGSRSNQAPDRYAKMVEAATKIQVQIMEGEVQIDRTLMAGFSNMPDFNEYPSNLLPDTKWKKIPASTTQEKQLRRMKSSSVEPRMRNEGSSMDLDTDSFGGNEIVKREFKKKMSAASSITQTLLPKPMSKKERKKNVMYDDIDRIFNFTYYFPHNNFTLLHPPIHERRKTGIFDYFSHSDTTKDTLKRFISILREKAKNRREENAKQGSNKRRSSIFGKFVGAPARSKFYTERPSFLGFIGSPKRKKNAEISKFPDGNGVKSEKSGHSLDKSIEDSPTLQRKKTNK